MFIERQEYEAKKWGKSHGIRGESRLIRRVKVRWVIYDNEGRRVEEHQLRRDAKKSIDNGRAQGRADRNNAKRGREQEAFAISTIKPINEEDAG